MDGIKSSTNWSEAILKTHGPFIHSTQYLELFMKMSINPHSIPDFNGRLLANSNFFPPYIPSVYPTLYALNSTNTNDPCHSSSSIDAEELNISIHSVDTGLLKIKKDSSSIHRKQKKPIPDEQKDGKYKLRRHRNNLAAKKSRELRKAREDQLVIKVAQLEADNARKRAHLALLREELRVLQLCLYQKYNGGSLNNFA